MDLIFPGKKPKELIEDRQDDDIDTGKKKKDDDVKGWFDGHPEIGKMQKDIFDDIFDTTDDDNNDDDDPAPLIPTPTDFQICYKGPTILVVQDGSGRKFGAHASSSWCDTEGGWVGNGESFLFSLEPKMAVFHSTGKDENYQLLTQELLAMGGSKGLYGLEMNNDLSGGTSSGDIETFHTIQLSEDPSFSIQHIEVWGLGPEPNPEQEKQNSRPRQPNLHTRGGNVDMLDLESQIM